MARTVEWLSNSLKCSNVFLPDGISLHTSCGNCGIIAAGTNVTCPYCVVAVSAPPVQLGSYPVILHVFHTCNLFAFDSFHLMGLKF